MERASFIFGLDGFAAKTPAAERRQKRPFNLHPFDLDRHSNDKKVQFILTIRATKGEWILLRITHKPSSEDKIDVLFFFFFFILSITDKRIQELSRRCLRTLST